MKWNRLLFWGYELLVRCDFSVVKEWSLYPVWAPHCRKRVCNIFSKHDKFKRTRGKLLLITRYITPSAYPICGESTGQYHMYVYRSRSYHYTYSPDIGTNSYFIQFHHYLINIMIHECFSLKFSFALILSVKRNWTLSLFSLILTEEFACSVDFKSSRYTGRNFNPERSGDCLQSLLCDHWAYVYLWEESGGTVKICQKASEWGKRAFSQNLPQVVLCYFRLEKRWEWEEDKIYPCVIRLSIYI